MKFDGFLKVYPIKPRTRAKLGAGLVQHRNGVSGAGFGENELPELEENELLELIKLIPEQHFTQPPPRYSEATLVKTFEEEGIGRPSTYAPIMSTIQERGYVEKDEKKYFKPTDIGTLVNDLLVEHFSKIVDIKFTAVMEEDLDNIAQGKENWMPVVRTFYAPFKENLDKKYQEVEKQTISEESGEFCEKCGKSMIIKLGKFGKFLACSGFPNCRNTKSIEASLKIKCPKCEAKPQGPIGEIIERKTKKGKIFYSCNRWPECDFALWSKPTGEKCPECQSLLVEEKNRVICSSKSCGYTSDSLERS